MERKQTIMPYGRYYDDELELLKQVFAENVPLMKLVRKIMLQLPITEQEEMTWHKTFEKNDALNALMRKLFFPEIDGDAPIMILNGVGSVVDLWATINFEGKMPEEVDVIIKAREKLINYVDQQLDVLSGKLKEPKILFKDFNLKSQTDLTARAQLISHIEMQLNFIYTYAGYKQETPEETIKRLQQNSNK